MIKRIYITLYFAFLAGGLLAQQVEVRIHGLPDSTEIPGARVRITSLNSDFEIQGVTNFSGSLFVSIPIELKGKAILEILSIGFINFKDTIALPYAKGQLTHIYLAEEDRLLNQVIVTASHHDQTQKESVYASKIIGEEKIRAMGAVSLNDVLSNELNIRLEQDNVLGAGVKLQGTGGQNVKILIDGVPVIGRLDGNIDLSQINLNNVERIEIIEGPLSVNYGSDALAGTINIITKKTLDGKWQANLNSFYESVGQYNMDLKLGKRFNHHLIEIHGGRYFFDGWSPGDAFWSFPQTTIADTLRTHLWKPKEQFFGGINYRYVRNSWNFRLNYEGYYELMTNRGKPQQPYLQRAFDDLYRTSRHTASLHFDMKIGKAWRGNILLSGAIYERNKNTYLVDLTNLDNQLVDNTNMHDTTGYTQYMSRGNFVRRTETGKWSVELGYEVSRESMKGRRIESGEQQMIYADLFATTEWKPITHFVIKPGIRYGYNSVYSQQPVPSLHLRYSLKSWILRASFARGFRAPSIKELYFEFIDINHFITGNPDLKAESSSNYQLNINRDYTLGKHRLGFELKSFYNDIYDQITLQVQQGTMEYSYFNLSRVQTTGANLTVEYAFSGIQLSAGTAMLAYKMESPTINYPNFLYSPELRVSAMYNWKKARLSFGMFYKYNGRQPNYLLDTEGNSFLGELQAFHMMDLSVTKSFLGDRIVWGMGMKNLFGVEQIVSSGSTGGAHSSGGGLNNVARGRSVFVSLKFNFVSHEKKKK